MSCINWSHLALRLRTAMKESGASFRDFELLTGINKSTLCRLAAEKRVDAETMLAVCEVLEIDPMSLLERSP